jgi:hypothetical protein
MPGPGESLTSYLRASRWSGLTVEPVSGYSFPAYDSWMLYNGRVITAGSAVATSNPDAPLTGRLQTRDESAVSRRGVEPASRFQPLKSDNSITLIN